LSRNVTIAVESRFEQAGNIRFRTCSITFEHGASPGAMPPADKRGGYRKKAEIGESAGLVFVLGVGVHSAHCVCMGRNSS
jgi:hypothetical protein